MIRKVVLGSALLMSVLLLAACGAGNDKAGADDIGGAGQPVQVSKVEVEVMESFPMQVVLRVAGELPTPCHELKWKVERDEAQRRIDLQLTAHADPGAVCIQVIQPFDQRIPLGDFEEYGYTIYLNGAKVGDF